MCIARHAQSTQNNKFAISLQYLKKEGRNEVGFLYADKYQTLLQFAISTLVTKASHAKSNQNNKFAKFFQYLKREVTDEVEFLVSKHLSFLYVSLKYLSTQYPCIVPRKNLTMKLIFCILINVKAFCKLMLSFLVSLIRNVQST